MRVRAEGKVFRSAGEWGELIARCETSGQKVSDFCMREGILPTMFYKWRKKLMASAESKLELVEAKISPRIPDSLNTEWYEIKLQSGRAIRVNELFKSEVLSELIRVVERC